MNACKYKRMYAYVHCMMIKQNHNKLNNKKYNFIVVFARTPHLPSSLRRWCCGPVVDVAILRGSSSQLASRLSRAFLAPSWPPTKLASSRLFRCVGLSCQSPWRWRARVRAVLLSVCTFAACVIGVASTLLSMLDEPRARYGSCVLAARRAPSTLR